MSVLKTIISALNLKQKGKHKTNLWKFPTVKFEDAKKIKSGITALYNKEVNGYLIKGFLKQDEVNHALANLHLLDSEANGKFSENAGYSNPRSFSMLANDDSIDNELLDQYLDDISKYKDKIRFLFPFGFEERLFSFISEMENNKPVEIPFLNWKNKLNYFTSSTIRVCYPGCGGMNTHVGNMFRTMYPKFYDFLDKLMDVDGQISYFIMLSKPEEGGRLVLLDAVWKQYVILDGKDAIANEKGESTLIKNMDYQLIDPEPGDMILFDGGDIWHRVEELQGKRDRITIGGFFAKTRDEKKVYAWA